MALRRHPMMDCRAYHGPGSGAPCNRALCDGVALACPAKYARRSRGVGHSFGDLDADGLPTTPPEACGEQAGSEGVVSDEAAPECDHAGIHERDGPPADA